MSTLIVATHNRHKTEEIAAVLGDFFDQFTDLASLAERHGADSAPEPVEDADSFEGNARIKAEAAAIAPAIALAGFDDAWILADDSGIEVDALDGRPGVYSARYAGENASDADNRGHLLAELDAAGARSAERRRGRFRCVLALLHHRGGDSGTQLFDGTVEGTIAEAEQGDGGFGYDPLFIPEGYDQSFGELPPETKHQLSHRGRALAKLRSWMQNASS